MSMYRNIVIESIVDLTDQQNIVFTQILNLSMFGEMKEYNQLFEVGEIVDFEIGHFEDSTDVNVQNLIRLFHTLGETIQSLANLNSISQEEIDNFIENNRNEP